MNKHEYLKQALRSGLAHNLSWIYSVFSIVKESSTDYLKDKNPYTYRLLFNYPQYKFINEKQEVEDIENTTTKEPLFKFKEIVDVDQSWADNIKEKTQTKIGNLIFNHAVILTSFGSRYPFINGKINLSSIEAYIANRLRDTPANTDDRDQSFLYVDEYLIFRDNLIYLEQLAPITVWSATRKLITKSPELDNLKKQLQKEYAGKLNNPVTFAEYEARLKQLDKEWLADDPSYGTFIKGKILDISRKKMFIGIGIESTLDPKVPVQPITKSLEEGIPTNPREYVAVVNGSRSGSYSRGKETENGGVVSKSIIRIGNNFTIELEDCGTSMGIEKRYSKDTIKQLIGRIVIDGNKQVSIEKIEQAENYLDKVIRVRSPVTCQASPGDVFCKKCSGEALSKYPKGLVIPLTEISSLILTQSLKAMHGKVLSTAYVDLDSVIS